MHWGAILSAVIVAVIMAIPTMPIMRWSKRNTERSDERQREKEAKRVALLAVERAAREKHLEELLRNTPLMQSTPQELRNEKPRKSENDS